MPAFSLQLTPVPGTPPPADPLAVDLHPDGDQLTNPTDLRLITHRSGRVIAVELSYGDHRRWFLPTSPGTDLGAGDQVVIPAGALRIPS